jgi:hypothetical protein
MVRLYLGVLVICLPMICGAGVSCQSHFTVHVDATAPTLCSVRHRRELPESLFSSTGIESSNIVESTGTRPRRAAAAAFIEAQQGKNTRKEQADSDDEASLITAPLAPRTVSGRYILANDDSD